MTSDNASATASEPFDERDWEVVVEVGAEGGSFRIYRSLTRAPIVYLCRLNQVALVDVMEEIDGEASDIPPISSSPYLPSFDAALARLDREPSWPLLYPRTLHPDHAERVLAAVEELLATRDAAGRARILDRWRSVAARPRRR